MLQHLLVAMPAQADGVESEKGATICGTSDLPTTAKAGLPGVAKEQLILLFEFEARKGFFVSILKYIKIGFAGGVFQPLLFNIRARGCSEPGSAPADLSRNP